MHCGICPSHTSRAERDPFGSGCLAWLLWFVSALLAGWLRHTVWASVLCTLTPFSRSYRTSMLGALCVYCVIISGEVEYGVLEPRNHGSVAPAAAAGAFGSSSSQNRGEALYLEWRTKQLWSYNYDRVSRNASSHGSYISSALLLE